MTILATTTPAQQQPSAPAAPTLTPGRITQFPHALRNWSITTPTLRFTFRTPEQQATFHRAFAQLGTSADRATFMDRFSDHYDGVVQVPRHMAMDTAEDEGFARQLQGEARTENDGEIARVLQFQLNGRGRHGGSGSGGGAGGAVENDEAMARRLQHHLERENGRRGYGTGLDPMQDMGARFGWLGLDERGPAFGNTGGEYRHGAPSGYGDYSGYGGYGGYPGYGVRQQYGNCWYAHPGPGDGRVQGYYDEEEVDDDLDGNGGYGPGYSGRGYHD